MKTFLKPFVKSLRDLWKTGVEWIHPVTKEKIVSKVVAPVLAADAPARANVFEHQEHQSKFACITCEQKAEPVSVKPNKNSKKQNGTIRRFLFQEIPAKLRTGERI